MDKFEKTFEDLDVHTSVMEGAMAGATATTTPASQVIEYISNFRVQLQIPGWRSDQTSSWGEWPWGCWPARVRWSSFGCNWRAGNSFYGGWSKFFIMIAIYLLWWHPGRCRTTHSAEDLLLSENELLCPRSCAAIDLNFEASACDTYHARVLVMVLLIVIL